MDFVHNSIRYLINKCGVFTILHYLLVASLHIINIGNIHNQSQHEGKIKKFKGDCVTCISNFYFSKLGPSR